MKPDVYHESAVMWFLTRPGDFMTSFDMKRFEELGDRVAATILVKVPETQLFEPPMVSRILRVVSMAFPNRGNETRLSAMPYLSLYLLRRMLAHLVDAESRTKIEDMIAKLTSIQEQFLDRVVAGEDGPPSSRPWTYNPD